MQGGQGETKIYLETLSDSDMKSIQSVLDDAKFQEIKTGPPRGGIVHNMDTLASPVSIACRAFHS